MLRHLISVIPGFRNDPVRIRQTLLALDRQARLGPAGENARTYKKIGDLCVNMGEQKRALSYYGRAIDAYLLSSDFDAAERLCRMVIAAVPQVVRTRGTLAFLTLRNGYSSAFETELKGYVSAAKRAGEGELAATRLRLMAAVTHEDDMVRLLIDQQLERLGERSNGLGELVGGFGADGRRFVALPGNQRDRWAFVLRLAITGPAKEMEHRDNAA